MKQVCHHGFAAGGVAGKFLVPALLLLLVLAIAAAAVWFLLLPSLDPLRLPPAQWREFSARYITPEGRVVDTGNGNISHSEGQGYGMLFAVEFGDRGTFDRIWDWTKRYLQIRPDKLLAWRWEPNQSGGGGVTDLNNASDGELLVAWALWKASARWKDSTYAQAAAQILSDLRVACFVESGFGLVLLPGKEGFLKDEDTLILNPSYFVFPALEQLQQFTLREEMQQMLTSGQRIVEGGNFGIPGFTADWISLRGEEIGLPGAYGFAQDFGYNAIRVPLQIAWQNPRSPLLQPYVDFWTAWPEDRPLPAVLELPSGTPGPNPALPGMVAVTTFVKSCAEGTIQLPRDVPGILPDEAYYSAALKLLTMIAARDANLKVSD